MDRAAVLPCQLSSGTRRESWLRTVYRVALSLVAPGFISHFPCDYELRLRCHASGSPRDTALSATEQPYDDEQQSDACIRCAQANAMR